ncbi:AMP-binding protein [Planomicrobium sp. Y74]|uniref:AMP-binding protein n=1 Tax=Planomicrobium sp. Y74 TaxID=2478977 RepID=UPI000EF4B45E|nr:AMP-binding protein [Planomicrobium sp. Y74]RLQ89928.1 AMP-dependent synthetase [Planomicrobium sp. Y74]
MFNLLKILSQLDFLAPSKIARLGSAIRQNGVNLMLLFTLTERAGGAKTALVDSRETLSYQQLQERCENLVYHLAERYKIGKGRKMAFFCRNHASLVQGIFAASRLGADLYLLNSSMSQLQFNRLVEEQNFDFLIYDEEFNDVIEGSLYRNPKIVSYQDNKASVSILAGMVPGGNQKLPPSSSGKVVLLTGGTTGKPKQVIHRPSLFNFLHPFAALLNRLHLPKYSTAFIATPIYHGYGIAVLLAFFALGKKVVIQDSFDAKSACNLIRHHQVEVVTVVPLMIHKMLKHSIEDLQSLACIASGGAKLNPSLVEEVNHHLGDVLYNLYGTSEAGLNIIAAPEDLKHHSNTLGKVIAGGRLQIVAEGEKVEPGNIGEFCIRNMWSMKNSSSRWIQTGDIGYRDRRGYYFLCGRTDDLIISAGNNIYPLEIECAITNHPCVEDAAVIGVEDICSGQILKAFVQIYPDKTLPKGELSSWLQTQLAGFQIPREIIFVRELLYTDVGKLDRKQVRANASAEAQRIKEGQIMEGEL